MTARRGEKKFRNDVRFIDWRRKCTQVIIGILHKNVFDDFDSIMTATTDKKSFQKPKKIQSLDRIKADQAYLENILNIIEGSNLPLTEEFKLDIEPDAIKNARLHANDITNVLKETKHQLSLREQFWYCLK